MIRHDYCWYSPNSLQRGKFTAKDDIWSFGMTLWEMLIMKKPYHCSLTNQILDKDQVMRWYVKRLKGLVSKETVALCWWELKHENLVSIKLIRWKWWVIVTVNLCNWKEEARKISGLQRSRWSPDIFQASSFQLLKFIKFTAMITLHFHLQPQYNMNFIYIFHKLIRVKFFPALILTSL